MTWNMDRRGFVRGATYGLAGWVLTPGLRAFGRLDPAGRLPPRTIGARTDGGDFRFDPVGLAIGAGDEVVWLNMGDFHTASAFHPDNAQLLSGDVPRRVPEGAESFHSGMLGLSVTEFQHGFEVPGVYDYFCQPHYSFGMVGRIVVGGDASSYALYPEEELNPESRKQMPALEEIIGPGGRSFEWAARLNGVLLTAANRGDAAAAAQAVGNAISADEDLQSLVAGAGPSPIWQAGSGTAGALYLFKPSSEHN